MLRSSDGRKTLELAIRHSTDSRHGGWLEYDLHLSGEGQRKHSLVSTHDNPLFLDNFVEPEVPLLIDGLRHVVEHSGVFVFEPVDERDFRLEAVVDNCSCAIGVRVADLVATEQVGLWCSPVTVSADEILLFSDDLERQYNELGKAGDPRVTKLD